MHSRFVLGQYEACYQNHKVKSIGQKSSLSYDKILYNIYCQNNLFAYVQSLLSTSRPPTNIFCTSHCSPSAFVEFKTLRTHSFCVTAFYQLLQPSHNNKHNAWEKSFQTRCTMLNTLRLRKRLAYIQLNHFLQSIKPLQMALRTICQCKS